MGETTLAISGAGRTLQPKCPFMTSRKSNKEIILVVNSVCDLYSKIYKHPRWSFQLAIHKILQTYLDTRNTANIMIKYSQELAKSAKLHKPIIVCLHPHCPEQTRYITGSEVTKHSSQCSNYLYGIDALLDSDHLTLLNYPPDSLGAAVRDKLRFTLQQQKNSYIHLLIEDFQITISRILQRLKEELLRVFPQQDLLQHYTRIYDLEPIKELLKSTASSHLITKKITERQNQSSLRLLKHMNDSMDQLSSRINDIVGEIGSLQHNYQKLKSSVVVTQKEPDSRKNPIKNSEFFEISYGFTKSVYVGSQKIGIDKNGWIQFSEGEPDHFKPWIYAQKGFKDGQHRMVLRTTKPKGASRNCGVCVIEERDLDTYPYSIYKSLHDRVAKQLKLIYGKQIHEVLQNGEGEVEMIMDFLQHKVILVDSAHRCQYSCSLKPRGTYYFGVVGEHWSVQILHLS